MISPREILSIGFRILVSRYPAIQTTGLLTIAPAGLSPAEHTSLPWSHFHTKAWSSFAPPPCRMPLGQSQDIPQADPGGMATPRFWHRLNSFRHVISGSLAFASLDRACRNLVPAFPQRSPPRHLAAAACGGLRSAPDCRTRRALLHLSYSYASPCGPALLVTQDPEQK